MTPEFSELCRHEPRLQELYELIPAMFKRPYGARELGCVDPFEFRWNWQVKPRIESLVGFGAKQEALRTHEAYECVVQVLRERAEDNA